MLKMNSFLDNTHNLRFSIIFRNFVFSMITLCFGFNLLILNTQVLVNRRIMSKEAWPKRSPKATSLTFEQQIIRFNKKYPVQECVVLSTFMNFFTYGELFIGFSNNTDFSFVLHQNSNLLVNYSNGITVTDVVR